MAVAAVGWEAMWGMAVAKEVVSPVWVAATVGWARPRVAAAIVAARPAREGRAGTMVLLSEA